MSTFFGFGAGAASNVVQIARPVGTSRKAQEAALLQTAESAYVALAKGSSVDEVLESLEPLGREDAAYVLRRLVGSPVFISLPKSVQDDLRAASSLSGPSSP